MDIMVVILVVLGNLLLPVVINMINTGIHVNSLQHHQNQELLAQQQILEEQQYQFQMLHDSQRMDENTRHQLALMQEQEISWIFTWNPVRTKITFFGHCGRISSACC